MRQKRNIAAEKSGTSLQSLIKAVSKQTVTDSSSSVIRSAIIRSVGQRDIGQGEASRAIFSGNHYESTFKFVNVSLDLGVSRIVKDAD